MGEVVDFPTAGPVPAPTGDAYLDAIELFMIRNLVGVVQNRLPASTALGVAHSREIYLTRHPELDGGETDPQRYLVAIITALHRLAPRQQAKVRHPSRDRREVQLLLEGQSL